jgi:pyruvate/2-oxoglutarate dehydrogenase complex dihydrolipoamide acyltransferase (E2) component
LVSGEAFHETRLPKHRELLGDLGRLTPRSPIQTLVEFDVTRARAALGAHKRATGETLSFTAWLIKCIGQAVSEYSQVPAYRKGNRLIVFDDVDVGFTMERESQGQPTVAGSIVRKANEKNFREIHEEVRRAQTEKTEHGVVVGEEEEARLAGFLQSMPGLLRRFAIWWYRRNPQLRKRTQGTVGLTTVGATIGELSGMSAFPIILGPYPLMFGVGAVSTKPGLVDGHVEPREYLPMSVMFDHDAVDGADAFRFIARLGELMKDGFGLSDV